MPESRLSAGTIDYDDTSGPGPVVVRLMPTPYADACHTGAGLRTQPATWLAETGDGFGSGSPLVVPQQVVQLGIVARS